MVLGFGFKFRVWVSNPTAGQTKGILKQKTAATSATLLLLLLLLRLRLLQLRLLPLLLVVVVVITTQFCSRHNYWLFTFVFFLFISTPQTLLS